MPTRAVPTFTPTDGNRHITPLTLDDAGAQTAQIFALTQDRVAVFARDPNSDATLRTEIFSVNPMLPSDLNEQTAACAVEGENGATSCYRVELYNFGLNRTMVLWIDVDAQSAAQSVVHSIEQEGAPPDLPTALVDRAIEIALNAPEVAAELGFDPSADQAQMANVKTSLNNTACERSRHLCVAPTFVVGQRALWAIVDLTDEALVGVRWTELGSPTGSIVTQQSMEYETVFERYCQQSNSLNQDGWSLDYSLTSSDGLHMSNIAFQDKPVVKSLKTVDWHVSYSGTDGFGYSDAIGCPIFSQAAVGAYRGPYTETITLDGTPDGEVIGFALIQDYAHPNWPLPCNYRYQQRTEFYRDGSWRPTAINLGRGCGDNGTYRPIMRIHLAKPDGGYTLEEWSVDGWKHWGAEGWRLQQPSTAFTDAGEQVRMIDAGGNGYAFIPSRGQFADGGRGDNAFVFATVYRPDEGESDLITLGSCCNDDYQQGPDRFINNPPESLDSGDIVLWYVAQMENDNTPGSEYCWADTVVENGVYVPQVWPCVAGPLITPFTDGGG